MQIHCDRRPRCWRQDFVGGLVDHRGRAIRVLAGADLPIGTFGGMGPGMLPRALAVLLGLLGALLVVERRPGRRAAARTLVASGAGAGARRAWWRSALAVRPLGLVVAGPLAIVISAFASEEVRWSETILFGALMTAFCIGLFKFALGLPIPLAPWLLGY